MVFFEVKPKLGLKVVKCSETNTKLGCFFLGGVEQMIIVDDIGGFLKWGNHPRHLDHFNKPMVLGIHNVIVIPNSIKKLFIFIYFMVIVPIIIYIYTP